MSVGSVWLFSIRLLCSRIDPAYCMAMVFITLNVCFIDVSHMLNFVSSCFIEGACVVPLAPAVMTMSGSTFQPRSLMSSISGWYFRILLFMVSWENLSLVYVNSISWTVRLAVGDDGGLLWYGSPLMQSISGLSLALQ